MKYIVENWFVIVGLIAVLAAGGYAIYVFVKMPSDKQLNKVREWLLYAVTKAEMYNSSSYKSIQTKKEDGIRKRVSSLCYNGFMNVLEFWQSTHPAKLLNS